MPDQDFLAALDSPDPGVRQRTATQAARSLDIIWLGRLERMALEDPDDQTRLVAQQCAQWMERSLCIQVTTLLNCAQDQVTPALVTTALQEGAIERRLAVVRAIAAFKAPWVVELLRQALAAEPPLPLLAHILLALGTRGDASDIQRLVRHLSHPDPRIRERAVWALGSMGHSVGLAAVTGILTDPVANVRVAGALVLRHANPHQAGQVVEALLSSKNPEHVRMGVLACAQLGPTFALPHLQGMLDANTSGVREAVIVALRFLARQGSEAAGELLRGDAHIGGEPPEAVNPMDLMLRAPADDPAGDLVHVDFRVRIRAALELRRVGGADSAKLLAARLEVERDPFVLATILSSLGSVAPTHLRPSIERFLQHQDPRVRASAVEALGRLGGERLRAVLTPFLTDDSPRIRANAVAALASVPGVDCSTVLQDMAAGTVEMRRSAAWALGVAQGSTSVELLERLIRDPAPSVSMRALQSLRACAERSNAARDALARSEVVASAEEETVVVVGGQEAHAEIDDVHVAFLLESTDPAERVEALRTVAELGDPRYLEHVRRAVSSDDVAVRFHARKALNRLLQNKPAGEATACETPSTPSSFDARLCSDEEHVRTRAALEAANVATREGAASVLRQVLARLSVEDSPQVRSALITQVGTLGDPTAAKHLLKFLTDRDARVRANTVEAIACLAEPESLVRCMSLLSDPDNRVRANVLQAMSITEPDSIAVHLQRMLDRPEEWERASAVHVLLTTIFPGREALIRQVLVRETHQSIYNRLLNQFVRDGATAWVPILMDAYLALTTNAKKARLGETLEALTGKPLQEMLEGPPVDYFQQAIDALLDPDPAARCQGINALASKGDAAAIPFLRRAALADLDPLIRKLARNAVRTLEPARPRESLPVAAFAAILADLLARPEPSVKVAALRRAVRECPETLLKLADRALTEDDVWVQANWAEVLGELADPAGMAACRVLVTRRDERVRAAAIAALGAMRDPQIGSIIDDGLADRAPHVRETCMRLLSETQPADSLPVLERWVGSPKEELALAGARWLRLIADPAAVPIAFNALLRGGPGEPRRVLAAILQARGRAEHIPDLLNAVKAGKLSAAMARVIVVQIAGREGIPVPEVPECLPPSPAQAALAALAGISADMPPPGRLARWAIGAATLAVLFAVVSYGEATRPRRLAGEAVDAFAAGHVREAKELCRAAREADPRCLDASVLLADIDLAEVGPAGARYSIGIVRVIDRAGLVTRRLEARANAYGADPGAAQKVLEVLSEQQPGDRWIQWSLGQALLAVGRAAEAADLLARVGSGPSGLLPARVDLLRALRGAGREKAAVIEGKDLLASELPDDWKDAVRRELGAALIATGDSKGALSVLGVPALTTDPSSLYHRGMAYEAMGDVTAAERSYREAAQSIPPVLAARIALSTLLIRRREFDKSRTVLERHLREYPADPDALVNLAVIAWESGDATAALHSLRSALTASPMHALARTNLERLRSWQR